MRLRCVFDVCVRTNDETSIKLVNGLFGVLFVPYNEDAKTRNVCRSENECMCAHKYKCAEPYSSQCSSVSHFILRLFVLNGAHVL